MTLSRRQRHSYGAHHSVGTLVVAGDAVAGKNLAHHALDAFGGVLDLGHVFPQDPAGHLLRGGGLAVAWPIRDPGAP